MVDCLNVLDVVAMTWRVEDVKMLDVKTLAWLKKMLRHYNILISVTTVFHICIIFMVVFLAYAFFHLNSFRLSLLFVLQSRQRMILIFDGIVYCFHKVYGEGSFFGPDVSRT